MSALMGRLAAANNAGGGVSGGGSGELGGGAGRFDKPSQLPQEPQSPIGTSSAQGTQGISDGVTDPRILDAIMSKLSAVKKTLGKQLSAANELKSKSVGKLHFV